MFSGVEGWDPGQVGTEEGVWAGIWFCSGLGERKVRAGGIDVLGQKESCES